MNPTLSAYLDVVRIIAAFLVVAGHMNAYSISGGLLGGIAHHATESVIVFFVLSGFVISYAVSEREQTLRSYILARTSRVYLVAILAVPVTLIADAIGSAKMPSLYFGHSFFNAHTGLGDIALTLTFLNEVWNSHIIIGSNEPFWSLGFEVWYYFIFGAFAFTSGKRRILILLAFILAAGPKIVSYLFIWLIGVATFKIVDRSRRIGRPLFSPVAAIVLFVSTPVFYFALHAHRTVWLGNYAFFGDNFRWNTHTLLVWFYFGTVAIIFALNIISFSALSQTQPEMSVRCRATIHWIAGATFTLYLMHEPIMRSLAAYAPGPVSSLAHVAFIAVGTLLIVYLIAELGERRKQAWRRLLSRLIDLGTSLGLRRSAVQKPTG